MKFYIQDPIFTGGYSLHEALLEACQDVIYGAGVFAFVTSGGVDLFLGDQSFENFMKRNREKFQLIVGIDEITNTRTLAKLQVMQDKYGEKLDIKVLMHSHKSVTFHPKFTWFKKEAGGIVIVGSNNLTEKGLRRNIEAFSINEVSEEEILEIQEYFNKWLVENDRYLLPIDNDDVIEKAKANIRVVSYKRKGIFVEQSDAEEKNTDGEEEQAIAGIPDASEIGEADECKDVNVSEELGESEEIDEEDFEAWTFTEDNSVLVAQIPRSDNRWSQANFNKDTFEQFFGARAGYTGSHRILLRSVNRRGKIQHIEVRPSVSVSSQNYRFELEAAKGLSYPNQGRPIAVFINLSVRMYVYALIMPGDSFYNEVDSYINHLKGNRMVRYITTVDDVRRNCPSLPLWNITR